MSTTKKEVLKKYYQVIDPLEELGGPVTAEYIEILTEISNHSARLRDNAVQTLFMEITAEKEDACEEAMEREKEAANSTFAEAIGDLRNSCHLNGCDAQVSILDALAKKMGFTFPERKLNKETPQTVLRKLAASVDTNDYSAEEIIAAQLAIKELCERP